MKFAGVTRGFCPPHLCSDFGLGGGFPVAVPSSLPWNVFSDRIPLECMSLTRLRCVQIDPAYKRKIEQIVRKPDKTEEIEPVEACPVCGDALPVTQLDCPSCKNFVPYCIVTVRI